MIIDDNGSVTLVLTENTVLAISTSASPTPKTETAKTPEPKTVVVTPPNTSSTVKVNPSTKGDNKLNITIQTSTKKEDAKSPKPSNSPQPTTAPTTQKTVDNVILRNAQKEPVITIKASSSQNAGLSIEQQNAKADTNLPIQIDSKTHVVSVDTESGTKPVSVLPDQAIKGADNKINSSLPATSSNVSLVSDKGQAEYVIDEIRKGKLLGIFNVNLPSQVKISAENGKTVSVWKSPLSFLSGFLIK